MYQLIGNCAFLPIPEERRILEETYRKRLEFEEEERQRKKQEKLDQERERQRQKELERKKKEEAEERAQRAKLAEDVKTDPPKKTVKDSSECKQVLLQWKQLQEEKKARLVGITSSHEGCSSEGKEAEPFRNTTPPTEGVALTLCGHAEETVVVTTTQAEGLVTPAPTEKRPSKYADIASYELTPADKVRGHSSFVSFLMLLGMEFASLEFEARMKQ